MLTYDFAKAKGERMNARSVVRAALARHDLLARATRQVVDARSPQLTPGDAELPPLQICKTNPNSQPRGDDAADGESKASRSIVGDRSTQASIPVDARLPELTSVDAGLPDPQICKTNPIRSDATLSPRQLAAARLLAQGRTVSDVATELRMTRQGLWKWRRLPAFGAELRRLHELLSKTNPIAGRR
jgi:hypothetical protein